MSLKLLGEFPDLKATDLQPRGSRHSRRELRRVELSLACPDARVSTLTAELDAARNEEAAIEEETGTRWTVVNHGRHNVNGGAWQVSVELDEAERLDPERLEFAGLSFTPSYYSEGALGDDDVILITAEVVPANAGEDAQLERLIVEHRSTLVDEETYFPLTRIGIAAAPLSVRFGRCLWQSQERKPRRHLVSLFPCTKTTRARAVVASSRTSRVAATPPASQSRAPSWPRL